MTRARSFGTGLAALALLASAVVGLPVVLYRFGGSPLPHHIASWRLIRAMLSRQDDAGLLLAVIRDFSWLAWLLFTVCVLAEAYAAVFSRRPPRLLLGGMQGAAAHLVALATLAFAAPSAITLSPITLSGITQSGIAQSAISLAASATSVSTHPAATRLVSVRAGDCLWSIAQRYLGSGDRYPEIVRLNYGHDMGDGLYFTNPALIEPGWQLVLPEPGGSASHAEASSRAGSQHFGHATRDPYYRRRHSTARLHVAHDHGGNGVADPRRSSSPRVVPSQSTVAGTGQSLETAPYRTSASADPAADQLPEAAVFVTGALAGAVLTSLTRLRWRQRQHRRHSRRIALPADRRVLAAEQRLRAAAPAETVALQTLREALASLEAGIVDAGQMLPDIVGLHVTPDVLEVLLGAPAPEAPPAPFVISPGRQGMCWQLELPARSNRAQPTVPGDSASSDGLAGEPARPAASTACHLLPGLVTVGATGPGYLLLDLESLQVTGCDGPPSLIDRVVSTTATELAAGRWSGWYDLILVGCDELEVLGRAEHCGTLDEALSLLEARCAAVGPRIAARVPADVRELRLAEPDNEDWSLTILISRAEPNPAQLSRLLEVTEDGPGGIAALIAGDPETPAGRMAPTALQLAPDPQAPDGIIANVVPLQISVRPRALSDTDYGAIATLFAVAADVDDVGTAAEPYEVFGAPPWLAQATEPEPEPAAGVPPSAATVLSQAAELLSPAPAMSPATGMPPVRDDALESLAGQVDGYQARQRAFGRQQLRVRILGPFMITGAVEQLQPKQAELVLALALAAPAGLSNSALCSILGADPDHPKPSDAVRQIITRTRRRIGPASDGQEYIIHAGSGRYLLHPEASLDWAEFRELVASGETQTLREAVSLIGGQPFTGSYFWWIDVPLIETVRAELVDAAETLAEVELAGGSARASARAARAGLLAEPSAEQLWRVLMRAEHAAGSMAGVTEAWRRCLDAIEEIAPEGEPHPETAALYRQLSAQPRQHASAR